MSASRNMGSQPTSKISFLDLKGHPLDVPLEWAAALIALNVDPDGWADVIVSIQGKLSPARLEKHGGAERIIVPWPRSGAGNYKIELSVGDKVEHRTITVRPQKISDDEYAELIEDVERRLPVSIAVGLQDAGALSGIELTTSHETTLAQEVQRLRRATLGGENGEPGLVSVLSALASDPHRILRTEQHWVRSTAARRPLATGLVQAIVRGGNLDATGRPRQILDQRVSHTVDLYENRLVAMFYHQVMLRMPALRNSLETRQNMDLLAQMDDIDRKLRRARLIASFLDGVSVPNALSMKLTMVLLRRPPYRAALERFLEFNRGMVIQLDEDILNAPLQNLPAIYQTWNTFVVIDALLEMAREHAFEILLHRLTYRRAGNLYIQVLLDGRPALKLRDPRTAAVITLTPEFSVGQGGRYHSTSFSQRPDMVIEIERPGFPLSLLVLDPKYKLDSEFVEDGHIDGRPKKEDIDKMHAYRDAIRDPNDRHPVAFAGILYPGPDFSFGYGIAAISARPGQNANLKARIRDLIENSLSAASA